jgi:hypothetical protein
LRRQHALPDWPLFGLDFSARCVCCATRRPLSRSIRPVPRRAHRLHDRRYGSARCEIPTWFPGCGSLRPGSPNRASRSGPVRNADNEMISCFSPLKTQPLIKPLFSSLKRNFSLKSRLSRLLPLVNAWVRFNWAHGGPANELIRPIGTWKWVSAATCEVSAVHFLARRPSRAVDLSY